MVEFCLKTFRNVGFLFGLILISLNVKAADSIELKGSELGQELVLGEALTLTVRGEDAVKIFETYEFGELKKNFVIDTVDRRSNRLRIKFYPYQEGEYIFPNIRLNDVNLKERLIKVVKNPDINIKWHELPQTLFFQKSIVQTAELKLPSDEWRLIPEAHLMNQSMREKWRLDVLDPVQPRENQYQLTTVFNYRGFVEPLSQRQEKIPSAHIKVRRPNGRYWHFFSPIKSINLHPLPSFLPADALVADLQWQSSKPTIGVYQDVNYWHWNMQAENVSPSHLKNLAQEVVRQLSEVKSVIWLSPEMVIQQSLKEKEGGMVVLQSLQLSIPFRPQQWFWKQPDIHLRFVNPDTQKWQVESLPAGWNISLPKSVFWALWVIGFVLLIWVLKQLLKVSRAFWHWQKMRSDCQNAQSVKQLLESLFVWQLARHPHGKYQAISSYSCEYWLEVYKVDASSNEAFEKAQELIVFAQQSLYAKLNKDDVDCLELLKNQCEQWQQTESAWCLVWRALHSRSVD
ncbi:hypothetical protein [Thiomicrorhabdus indica]|uniref:hypothetical protein n=1 Tax=Thiomicrorhabdus indica TaxID=2267253 RepID=UPI002AA6F813|nr:hypothetical protein [Thiomicrorhabdus indica]